MFEELFVYPKVLARHRAGPLADAREQFLVHCAGYGAARHTLLCLASELLLFAERMDVSSGKTISLTDVEAAADSWTRYQRRRKRARSGRWPRLRFIQVATAWLRFLGRLEEQSPEPNAFAGQVDDFIANLRVAHKQSMGMRFRTEARTLKSFCRAMGEVNLQQVNPNRVHAYLADTGPITTFWERKHRILDGFYRFVIARGHVTFSPLPRTVPKPLQPHRP